MNYRGVTDVRQGKYFLLNLESPAAGSDSAESEAAARAEVDRIAREVLVNPVIEEYTFRLEA
jgi:phosphoribosylformylglycinamidine synthase